ncbi:hypothetical protein [Sorangium sp. So ce1151]|uniref:hypothetical protein n=1 Tax=Sorangium sp. So ce1151 TaxID=3133332 RepID=UPI003F61EA9B
MNHRTSLPLLVSLMTFLVSLAACSVEIVDGGTGAGGDGTGTGGDGTGAGGDGTGAGGDGTGAGGDGTGAGGTGPGGRPACEAREPRVFACADIEFPEVEDRLTPRTFAFSGTVTAVRPPDADELCARNTYKIGGGAPEVMIDLADEAGNALTVGFTVPGFASSAVAVGDPLDFDFSHDQISEYGKQKISRIRLEREGELVVAAGESDPLGVTLGDGERECYSGNNLCAYEAHAMTVSVDGEPAVSIPNGESAEIGELTVTNDLYIKNYEIDGGCNFGLSVEYIVGAAPTP